MFRQIAVFFILVLSLPFACAAVQDDELLTPDQAFPVAARLVDPQTIRIEWAIADGYYLYRSKLRIRSDTPQVHLGEPLYPAGAVKHDEFFGDVEIYRGKLGVDVALRRDAPGATELTLALSSQGCADVGVCYPPHHQKVSLALPAQPPQAAKMVSPLTLLGPKPAKPLQDDDILEPDQAFQFDPEVVDGRTLAARWVIAPGHYLYKDKLTFELKNASGIGIGAVELPVGEEKEDEFFGRIRVFHNEVAARLALERNDADPAEVTLAVGYQGCAEAGICYPPIKKQVTVQLPAADAAALRPAAVPAAMVAAADGPLSEQDRLARSLASGNTLATLATFLGLGLLLAFTPCIFPMVPILSSIIVGQGHGLTTRKAFTLSLTYVLAMALTYTAVGVVAGLFGANIQAAFQNPWVIGAFAAVFVALAFSMFGFYELQLPSALQSRLAEMSNRQQGGTLAGVAIMGLLSALIVGPCVAPPLMGALIYIGQTGDPWLGGAALFALSLGMGAPLLAIGTAGGKLLPRAGGWMNAVKAVFGVLLLGVAVWMLERVLPSVLTMLLWALLLVVSAVYMGTLEPIRDTTLGWRHLWKGLGLTLLIYGTLLLIGLASGGRDRLEPLAHLRAGLANPVAAAQVERPRFTRVKSADDLRRELAIAAANGQPVMLDFYADWCVSCKEFEKYTFPDPRVATALAGSRLLQADVTANDEADQALLRELGLIGPPAILFYGPDGRERRHFRVVGYQGPDEFAPHVQRALAR